MATGSSIYAAVPALAAAVGVGFYFFDTNHVKELARGISMIVKVEEESKALHKPKVAPQLDGLHCFETLVTD